MVTVKIECRQVVNERRVDAEAQFIGTVMRFSVSQSSVIMRSKGPWYHNTTCGQDLLD